MTSGTMKATITAVGIAVVAMGAPLSAQQSTVAMKSVASPTADRAAALRSQADALLEKPSQWRRAARLLERSAELSEAGDPAAYMTLVLAGRVRAALDHRKAARQNFAKAAEHALARGAVLDAAHAFIDAAHAALQAGENQLAHEFVDRATLLTGSPLLTQAQRAGIERRLRA